MCKLLNLTVQMSERETTRVSYIYDVVLNLSYTLHSKLRSEDNSKQHDCWTAGYEPIYTATDPMKQHSSWEADGDSCE
jgi:hypothetical protein